jgi:hypothetical protein
MAKKAWVEGVIIRDIAPAGDPTEFYEQTVAAYYTVSVPDDAVNGDTWDGNILTKKIESLYIPPAITLAIDPTEWFIDIGPFFDRFGAAKMAVLTSTDAGVKAIMSDVSIRKWIDLKRADVAQSLAYIGTKVSSVDSALQISILTTPVVLEENLALRKLYFS